jgi:cytochrome c peroxidase
MSVTRIVALCLGLLVVGLLGWWWWHGAPPSAGDHRAYMPPATDLPVTPLPEHLDVDYRKVALGEKLFHDKRLSADDTIACASCHALDNAGQDQRPLAVGITGKMGTLNSPTVFNAVFNFRQFWDGRSASLEEQAQGPVHNPLEMASNWPAVIDKLGRDPAIVAEFKAIWPDGLAAANIQSAIAEFERTLITPNAAFDRFLRGDQDALSATAKQGWRLFLDRGCIACHQGVNLGGNLYANLGVMGDYFADRGRPVTKADMGRYNVTGQDKDRFVFKVPGLRNITKTAPYFHDGSIATLDMAVDTMARYQLGIRLGPDEIRAILAFLDALSGEYLGRPL